jgi:branched-chain amino acid transport system permease protein
MTGPAASPKLRRGAVAAALVLFVTFVLSAPQVLGLYQLFQIQTIALYVLVVAGLTIATGFTGIISVGHASLMAVGAYATAYLAVQQGWGMVPVLLAGMAAASVLGVLLAVPTSRLGHFYFAMITLGLALVTEQLLLEWDWTGGYTGLFGVPRPDLFGVELDRFEFFYFVMFAMLVTVIGIRNLLRSPWGRRFMLVRDDEVAASALGVNPYLTKLRSFTLSALPAGLAGGLFAFLNQTVTPFSFSLHIGLFFMLAVVVGGRSSVFGPIVGVVVFFAVPEYLREYRAYSDVLFGVILLVVVTLLPGGLAAAGRKLRDRMAARRGPAEGTAPATGLLLSEVGELPDFVRVTAPMAIETRSMSKAFGGLKVLSDVTVDLPSGEVVAIIGPNGSGKTTMLNLICGYYRHSGGEILAGGSPLPTRPAAVARRGIGRTFQTPKVLDDCTALENVMAGSIVSEPVSMLESITRLGRYRAREHQARERATALLRYVGLGDRMDTLAGELPHPHLRFLEIARALMAQPRYLLLDEPAAGLSATEVAHLDTIVRDLAAAGLGVAIVEHNIGLVLGVADRMVVLDSGTIVASGHPEDVSARPEVAQIYLGADWHPEGAEEQPSAGDAPPAGDAPRATQPALTPD